MHTLSDENLTKMLDHAPDPAAAIKELFQQARIRSEDRFFLSLLDVERFYIKKSQDPEPWLMVNETRQWVTRNVVRFLAKVSMIPEDAPEDEQELIRYVQLLGYSQLWECLGLQRFMWNLVRTASGGKYEPEVLIADEMSTANIMKNIIDEARSLGLNLAQVLEALYHNVIRNAFAHSDFVFFNQVISSAPEIARKRKTFYIRFETWDRLLAMVMDYVKNLLTQRHEAEAIFAERSPYTFVLDELKGPHTLYFDKKKRWIFKH